MANRYWVGDGGDWSDAATHWASSTGGAPNAANLPTSADNVFFDANSFTVGAQVVVVNIDIASCADMDWTDATDNPTLDLATNSSYLYIYGSLTLIAAMTLAPFGIHFKAITAGKIITTNGQVISGNAGVHFNGIGGGWTLQDDCDFGGVLFLDAGALDFNDKDVWCTEFDANQQTTTRSLSAGSGTWTIDDSTSNNKADFMGAGFTFNCETSKILLGSVQTNLLGNGKTFYDVTCNSDASFYISGSCTFHDLTLNVVDVTSNGWFYFPASSTTTVTGTLTISGISINGGRAILKSFDDSDPAYLPSYEVGGGLNYDYSSTGIVATISAAIVSIQWTDFQDITGSGAAAPFTGTSLGNMGGNSGITFTAAVTRYWRGGSGSWVQTSHWDAHSGGAGGDSVPICHDTAVFDGNSFTAGGQSVDTSNVLVLCAMNWTDATNNPAFDTWGLIYGQVTFIAGMTYNPGSMVLNGRSNQTFTTGGKTLVNSFCNFVFDAPGATYTFVGDIDLGSANNITAYLFRGTFDANGNDVTAYTMYASGDWARHIKLGSGTWTFNGYSCQFASTSSTASNTTITCSTSTIVLTGSCGSWDGGGKTYYDIISDCETITMQSNDTFHDLTFNSNGGQQQILFASGKTTTITGTLTAAATDSVLNRMRFITWRNIDFQKENGVAGTVSAAIVALTDVDFYDITAAGAAAPFTGTRLCDGGGNSNITFQAPKTVYWVGGAGDWSDAVTHWAAASDGAPGAANFPLCQDSVVFDDHSFTLDGDTINVDTGGNAGVITNMDWTGATHSPIFDIQNLTTDFETNNSFVILGNLTLISTVTMTDASDTGRRIYFAGRGTQNLTTNTSIIDADIFFMMGVTNGHLNFLDAPTFDPNNAHYIKLLSGVLDFNNFNVTSSRFWSADSDDDEYDYSSVRTLLIGTGTLHLTGDDDWDSVLWINDQRSYHSAWMTLDADQSTILIDANTAVSKTVILSDSQIGYGEDFIYGKLVIDDIGGGTFNFTSRTDGATIKWFQNLVAPASLIFGSTGWSMGITIDRWDVNGTAGNLVQLYSYIDEPNIFDFMFAKTGKGQLVSDYLDVSYLNAVPGTFLAGRNSVDGGDNTGIEFVNPIKGISS